MKCLGLYMYYNRQEGWSLVYQGCELLGHLVFLIVCITFPSSMASVKMRWKPVWSKIAWGLQWCQFILEADIIHKSIVFLMK